MFYRLVILAWGIIMTGAWLSEPFFLIYGFGAYIYVDTWLSFHGLFGIDKVSRFHCSLFVHLIASKSSFTPILF